MLPHESSRARALRAAALCGVALFAAPALAQSPSSGGDPEAQRTGLYREGVSLANGGQWEAAVARFREVVAIRAAPPALFTLGQAEEHLGHWVSAKRDYARARADATAAGAHDVADAAQKALVAVDAHIARLTIHVAASPQGVTASIDGAPASVGEPVDIDPGWHQVSVRAPDRTPYETRVRASAGDQKEVNATLGGGEAAAPTPVDHDAEPPAERHDPPAAEGSGGGVPVGPLVLGSVGLLAGVVGLVVRQTAQSSFDSASAPCASSGACPMQSDVDQGNAARTRIIAGDVTLGIGLAAVAVAGTWWLVAPRKSPSPVTVGLRVLPGPRGARLGLGGSF